MDSVFLTYIKLVGFGLKFTRWVSPSQFSRGAQGIKQGCSKAEPDTEPASNSLPMLQLCIVYSLVAATPIQKRDDDQQDTPLNSLVERFTNPSAVFYITSILLLIIITAIIIYYCFRRKRKAIPFQIQPRKSSISKTFSDGNGPADSPPVKRKSFRFSFFKSPNPIKNVDRGHSILGFYEPSSAQSPAADGNLEMQKEASNPSLYSSVSIPQESALKQYLSELDQESRVLSLTAAYPAGNSYLSTENFMDGSSVVSSSANSNTNRLSIPAPMITESDALDVYLDQLRSETDSDYSNARDVSVSITQLEPAKLTSRLGKRDSSLSVNSKPLNESTKLKKLLVSTGESALSPIGEV